jgi:hypothetical protein
MQKKSGGGMLLTVCSLHASLTTFKKSPYLQMSYLRAREGAEVEGVKKETFIVFDTIASVVYHKKIWHSLMMWFLT